MKMRPFQKLLSDCAFDQRACVYVKNRLVDEHKLSARDADALVAGQICKINNDTLKNIKKEVARCKRTNGTRGGSSCATVNELIQKHLGIDMPKIADTMQPTKRAAVSSRMIAPPAPPLPDGWPSPRHVPLVSTKLTPRTEKMRKSAIANRKIAADIPGMAEECKVFSDGTTRCRKPDASALNRGRSTLKKTDRGTTGQKRKRAMSEQEKAFDNAMASRRQFLASSVDGGNDDGNDSDWD